jgi:hypothetical protein
MTYFCFLSKIFLSLSGFYPLFLVNGGNSWITNRTYPFIQETFKNAHIRRRLALSGETITYSYTGAYEAVLVPSDVNSIVVSVTAASSGIGTDPNSGTPGYGANVQATISVTPGSILYVFIGGQGALPAGGWNGGGDGIGLGSGGGGASDIRIGGTSLNNRIVVAGGGGGYYYTGGCATPKGGDGGQVGSNGGSGTTCSDGGGGGGGATQSAGGTAGALGNGPAPVASPGSLGLGGKSAGSNAGGGGGGYYGGNFYYFV